jgi:hypothetical protein
MGKASLDCLTVLLISHKDDVTKFKHQPFYISPILHRIFMKSTQLWAMLGQPNNEIEVGHTQMQNI